MNSNNIEKRELPYLENYLEVQSEEGKKIKYQELNVEELSRNFSYYNPVLARKTAKTIVVRAKGGENIITRNIDGKIETTYTVKKEGACIFANTPDGKYDRDTIYNPTDVYVPRDQNGNEWEFDTLLSRSYKVVRSEHPKMVGYENYDQILLVESTDTFQILHEAITKPTVIFDKERNPFYYLPGATIKLNKNNKISLIDGDAFTNTWEVIDDESRNIEEKSV